LQSNKKFARSEYSRREIRRNLGGVDTPHHWHENTRFDFIMLLYPNFTDLEGIPRLNLFEVKTDYDHGMYRLYIFFSIWKIEKSLVPRWEDSSGRSVQLETLSWLFFAQLHLTFLKWTAEHRTFLQVTSMPVCQLSNYLRFREQLATKLRVLSIWRRISSLASWLCHSSLLSETSPSQRPFV